MSLADGQAGPATAGVKSNDAASSEKCEVKETQTTAPEKTFSRFLRGRLRIRPQLAFSVSVSSLLYSLCVCVWVATYNFGGRGSTFVAF